VATQPRHLDAKPSVVRAEQVGSLLRPPALLKAADARNHNMHVARLGGSDDNGDGLESLEDTFISEAIARQLATGIGVISDGEFRRLLYTESFYASVTGFDRPSERTLVFRGEHGRVVEAPAHPVVAKRLEKVANPPAEEARYLASMTDRLFKVTIPAASKFLIPGVFRPGISDADYADPDALLEHIVAIEQELIAETVTAGARYIQLDFPLYTYLVDPDRRAQLETDGVDVERLLARCIEADSAVVSKVPDNVYTSLHICRGNYRSMWLYRGALDPVAERVFGELPYDSFLVEWDEVGRDGDYSALRYLAPGRVVSLGLVSTKSARLETWDHLLAEIDSASRYVDVQQLALSPQCGFASEASGNLIDSDTQWRKLELVAETAGAVWPNG